MSKERTRDRVWKYALAGAIRNGRPVTPDYIAEVADVSERTAREALNVIADLGWLTRKVRKDGSVRFVAPDTLEYTGD